MATTIQVSSSILYGVWASEKSFLIGVRCLVKREHTHILTLRVTGDRLPIELADAIAEHLYHMERPGILARWKPEASPEENYQKFHYDEAQTEAERRAFAMMHALNVDVAWITNSRILSIDRDDCLPESQNACHYLHLSALKKRPSFAVALPPGCKGSHDTGLHYATAKGRLRASVSSGTNTCLAADEIEYERSPQSRQVRSALSLLTGKGRAPGVRVERLLSVEGLEEAIRDWDAVALKKYVHLLGLVVIPTWNTDAEKSGVVETEFEPNVFVLQGWED